MTATTHNVCNDVSDIHDTLRIIELNIINNCNRQCEYCPHSTPEYKHTQGYMNLGTVDVIVNRLNEYKYKNIVSICGYGEPTVHKELPDIINRLSNTEASIELITNGDLLTESKVKQYFDNGLTFLNVSAYDAITDANVTRMLSSLDNSMYVIKRKYIEVGHLVNRISILEKNGLAYTNPCYLTSYKMMVDIDGSTLLCCNDWDRTETFGNVHTSSIEKIWLDNLNERRMALISGDRSVGACRYCNISGTLTGESSVKLFLVRK